MLSIPSFPSLRPLRSTNHRRPPCLLSAPRQPSISVTTLKAGLSSQPCPGRRLFSAALRSPLRELCLPVLAVFTLDRSLRPGQLHLWSGGAAAGLLVLPWPTAASPLVGLAFCLSADPLPVPLRATSGFCCRALPRDRGARTPRFLVASTTAAEEEER